ncbi:LysR substrate-binding domain-containing protein, partial [Pseudomonas aeruginosa]
PLNPFPFLYIPQFSRFTLLVYLTLSQLELGIVAAARGYGVSIGDLVMVAEDVAQGRIGLPWPVAVVSGESYHLVWPRARRGQERFQRLRDFLLAEVAAMRLPVVERLA